MQLRLTLVFAVVGVKSRPGGTEPLIAAARVGKDAWS
jgi:hypothetical protein